MWLAKVIRFSEKGLSALIEHALMGMSLRWLRSILSMANQVDTCCNMHGKPSGNVLQHAWQTKWRRVATCMAHQVETCCNMHGTPSGDVLQHAWHTERQLASKHRMLRSDQ
jgi:hypothetical protein